MTYLPGLEPYTDPSAPDGDGDEWYTPRHILDAVALLDPGGIDLDPCHAPRSLVQARHTIDVRQDGDGLRDEWPGDGLVFVNPPYSDVEPWLARCRHEAKRRPVVALVPMRPETQAWRRWVWEAGATVVVHTGRIAFVAPDGTRPGGGMLTTCLLTWDADLALRLVTALGRVGVIARAVGVLS